MSFGIIAESVLAGYRQNPSQSFGHLNCHGRWLDTPAIHLEAVFNEDNNNNKKALPLVPYLVCYCLLCGYFPYPRCDLSNFFYPRVLTEVFYLVVYGYHSNLVLHNRNGFNINTINIIVSYIFLFNYIISGVTARIFLLNMEEEKCRWVQNVIFFSIRTKNNPRPCYSCIAMAHA